MIIKKSVEIAVAAFIVATTCQATVVYSAPPDHLNGSDMNNTLVADTFTLPSPVEIYGVRFWAVQDDITSYTGSIDWALYSDASGMPGSVLASGTSTPDAVATGVQVVGLNEFVYEFPIDVVLSGSVPYWLALHNGPTSTIPANDMFWETSNANSGISQTMDLSAPGQPWVDNFTSLAFELEAPEPGTWVLVASGLLGGFLIRRRRAA
jgi:PEP-CTERM motif